MGWLLWSFFPFRRRDGEAIALLLTIHPITRFLLEIIRTDEPAVFGTGMTISQNVSLGLLACGAALWWYLRGSHAASFGHSRGPPIRNSLISKSADVVGWRTYDDTPSACNLTC